MAGEHTPGPWKVYDAGRDDHLFVETNGKGSVCKLARKGPDKRDRELELANARLIAAAPELLEALEEVDRLYSSQFEKVAYADISNYGLIANCTEAGKMINLVRAAIRKAKGEL